MHIEAFKRRAGLEKHLWIISNIIFSTSDLQPSTAIASQLPGH